MVVVMKFNLCPDSESRFGQDFEVEVQVTKLNLGQYSEARIGQNFNFRFSQDADVWLRF